MVAAAVATFRELYSALMVANGKTQLAIARTIGYSTNAMVHDVVFADGKRKTKLPLDRLEDWIAALGETTREQREALRDAAYTDYGTERERQARSVFLAIAGSLRALREVFIKHHLKVPEQLGDLLQQVEAFLGE